MESGGSRAYVPPHVRAAQEGRDIHGTAPAPIPIRKEPREHVFENQANNQDPNQRRHVPRPPGPGRFGAGPDGGAMHMGGGGGGPHAQGGFYSSGNRDRGGQGYNRHGGGGHGGGYGGAGGHGGGYGGGGGAVTGGGGEGARMATSWASAASGSPSDAPAFFPPPPPPPPPGPPPGRANASGNGSGADPNLSVSSSPLSASPGSAIKSFAAFSAKAATGQRFTGAGSGMMKLGSIPVKPQRTQKREGNPATGTPPSDPDASESDTASRAGAGAAPLADRGPLDSLAPSLAAALPSPSVFPSDPGPATAAAMPSADGPTAAAVKPSDAPTAAEPAAPAPAAAQPFHVSPKDGDGRDGAPIIATPVQGHNMMPGMGPYGPGFAPGPGFPPGMPPHQPTAGELYQQLGFANSLLNQVLAQDPSAKDSEYYKYHFGVYQQMLAHFTMVHQQEMAQAQAQAQARAWQEQPQQPGAHSQPAPGPSQSPVPAVAAAPAPAPAPLSAPPGLAAPASTQNPAEPAAPAPGPAPPPASAPKPAPWGAARPQAAAQPPPPPPPPAHKQPASGNIWAERKKVLDAAQEDSGSEDDDVRPAVPMLVQPGPGYNEDLVLARALEESLRESQKQSAESAVRQRAAALEAIGKDRPAAPQTAAGAAGSSGRGAAPAQASGALGMRNQEGEYNCFLNVLIQSLWHLPEFRRVMLESGGSGGSEGKDSGAQSVVAALRSIFAALRKSDVAAAAAAGDPALPSGASDRVLVAPTALRDALSARFGEAGLFQHGQMNDAAEALGSILDCLDRAEGEREGSWIRKLFGINLHSEFTCAACRKTTYDTKWTQLHELGYAFLARERGLIASLLEERLTAQRSCDTDKGGCGKVDKLKNTLRLPLPAVFTIVISWDSRESAQSDVAAFFHKLDTTVQLSKVFGSLENQWASVATQHYYRLRAMVCFYGSHYMAFARSEAPQPPPPPPRGSAAAAAAAAVKPGPSAAPAAGAKAGGGDWIYFDDSASRKVGEWEAVVAWCVKGKLQPVILFYEADVRATWKNAGAAKP